MEKLVVCNWKMNYGGEDGVSYLLSLLEGLNSLQQRHLWIAAPFTVLERLSRIIKERGSAITIGAQNVHWEERGAFTGEVSPIFLKEARVSFSLIGHSERRHIFSEDNNLCAKRALGALRAGLKVIFCVGETLEERECGNHIEVVKRQLSPLLTEGNLSLLSRDSFLIAYEPVWSIGTGKVPAGQDIEQMHRSISDITSQAGIKDIMVLYGGSVSPGNIEGLVKLDGVDGFLVGGASLKLETLIPILEHTCAE